MEHNVIYMRTKRKTIHSTYKWAVHIFLFGQNRGRNRRRKLPLQWVLGF